jgi:hypothetical protein
MALKYAPASASNIRVPFTGSFVGATILKRFLETASIEIETGETGSLLRINRSLAALLLFTGEAPCRCRVERVEADP